MFILLPIFALLEIIKRIVTIPFFPIAYFCRESAREDKDNSVFCKLIWFLLDDSINETGKPPLDYCTYAGKEPLGFITERLPEGWFKEFMRAWNWGAFRNNTINFMIWTQNKIGAKVEVIYRKQWGTEPSFYEVRKFASGIKLPYFEWWPLKGFRIQLGWISSSRWHSQARTKP